MGKTFWAAVAAIGTVAGVFVAIWIHLDSKKAPPVAPPPPPIDKPEPPVPQCAELRLNLCDLNPNPQANRIINSCRAYIAANPNNPAAYQSFGRAHLALGQLDEAERQFDSQLALGVRMQDNGIVGQASFNQATVYLRRGALDRTESLVRKSLALTISNSAAQAGNNKLLGDVHYRRNDFRAAATYFQTAVDIYRGHDEKYGLASALVGLGFSKLRNRDRASGCFQLREARRLFVESSCTRGIRDIEKHVSQTACD